QTQYLEPSPVEVADRADLRLRVAAFDPYRYFGQELRFSGLRRLAGIAPVGQQVTAEQQHDKRSGDCGHDADRGYLEDRERRLAGLASHAIDEDVRGRADQRARAAEDRGIGNGD